MRHVFNGRAACTGATLFLLGAATLALAQFSEPDLRQPRRPVLEYTQQQVQANLLVQTMNDMSKQRWDVFQITPVWTIRNLNGETELAPKAYEVFARRPLENAK